MFGGHNMATLRQTKMKQTDSNSPCSVDTTRPLSGRLKWSRQTPAVHVRWTQHGHSPTRKGGHVCPVFTVNHTSSSLLSHRLWYSSSIPLWTASSPPSFSLSSLSLRYSDIPCSWGGQENPGGEILSIHRTCHLELSFSLCQAFVFTLSFLVKSEKPPPPSAYWSVAFFLFIIPTHHQSCMYL